MAGQKESKMDQIAESSLLKILGRVSGPLLVGICIWMLKTVTDVDKGVSTLSAQYVGLDTRVHNLEDWRNYGVMTPGASAESLPPTPHHN